MFNHPRPKCSVFSHRDGHYLAHRFDHLIFTVLLLVCRYSLSGRVMPTMREWMQKIIGIDVDHRSPAQVRRCDNAFVHHSVFVHRQIHTQTKVKTVTALHSIDDVQTQVSMLSCGCYF